MSENRLIHGSYGEQRYLHSDEVFRKERNWNINLPSEREFKDGYCIITDKDDTAYSIDELVELLNEFQKENEQLKSKNRGLQSELQIFKEDVTHSNLQINKLVDENEQLKQRNNRQYEQLDRLYNLIEQKDWRALNDILDDFKRCEEQLQREWGTYGDRMTEKRFTMSFSGYHDNGKLLTANECLECLNALHEENQRLKEYEKYVGDVKREELDRVFKMSIYEIAEAFQYYKKRINELEELE